jgi:ABC-type multidrug transport system fused ATPase/permease subunit
MARPSYQTPSYPTWSFIKDVARLISPYKVKFLAGFFLRLTSDIANLYPAWALSRLVLLLTESGELDQKLHILWLLILGWFASVIYFGVAHALAKWFGYQVAERVALDARLQSLRHIFSLDIAWQEKENTGNKLKRISQGSESLNQIIRIFYDVIIEASLNSLGMLVIFTLIGGDLAMGLVVFMICYFILSSILTRKAAQQAYEVSAVEEELEGLSFESLNNIKTVKSLSIQEALLSSSFY